MRTSGFNMFCVHVLVSVDGGSFTPSGRESNGRPSFLSSFSAVENAFAPVAFAFPSWISDDVDCTTFACDGFWLLRGRLVDIRRAAIDAICLDTGLCMAENRVRRSVYML